MAHAGIPHFHNTDGISKIEIGAREFQCIGALPPFDHPHVYLDMGKENEIVCPYCSTHYVFSAKITAGLSDPISAVYQPQQA
ncbi:MAG TPA: zinc-finger domain-containing protein [Devosia sp.]|nr:zinc-finger domain-containing protein [Devosia sp.]